MQSTALITQGQAVTQWCKNSHLSLNYFLDRNCIHTATLSTFKMLGTTGKRQEIDIFQ